MLQLILQTMQMSRFILQPLKTLKLLLQLKSIRIRIQASAFIAIDPPNHANVDIDPPITQNIKIGPPT